MNQPRFVFDLNDTISTWHDSGIEWQPRIITKDKPIVIELFQFYLEGYGIEKIGILDITQPRMPYDQLPEEKQASYAYSIERFMFNLETLAIKLLYFAEKHIYYGDYQQSNFAGSDNWTRYQFDEEYNFLINLDYQELIPEIMAKGPGEHEVMGEKIHTFNQVEVPPWKVKLWLDDSEKRLGDELVLVNHDTRQHFTLSKVVKGGLIDWRLEDLIFPGLTTPDDQLYDVLMKNYQRRAEISYILLKGLERNVELLFRHHNQTDRFIEQGYDEVKPGELIEAYRQHDPEFSAKMLDYDLPTLQFIQNKSRLTHLTDFPNSSSRLNK